MSFSWAFEAVFKGFDISVDKKLVDQLSLQGAQGFVLVKKSAYFLVFSWLGTRISLITSYLGFLAALFFLSAINRWARSLLALIVTFFFLWRLISLARFLYRHKKTYHTAIILDAWVIKQGIDYADDAFRDVIDWTSSLVILNGLYCIFAVIILIVMRDSFDTTSILLLLWTMALMIRQQYALGQLLLLCIDLAMDFLLFTERVIKFYDQKSFGVSSSTIAMTDLKSIASQKTSLVQSSLDFGIITFTLSGTDSLGEIVMPYIKSPENVERAINIIQNRQWTPLGS